VDNHSDDDSVQTITTWLEGKQETPIKSDFPEWVLPEESKPIDCKIVKTNSADTGIQSAFYERLDHLQSSKVFFIQNSENAGFAKGNNLIIRYFLSSIHQYDYIYLLNNDTVIAPDTISGLVNTMEAESIDVANSVIYYYYEKDKIAFAGGRLLPWAKAKYFTALPEADYQSSAFAHGCALMVKKEVFEQYGVLTENFFHGEEDFEFSWRLKDTPVHIACVTSSRVYHKEGSSIGQDFNRKKSVFLYALNRLIDMKFYFNPLKWFIWKQFALAYFLYLLVGKYKYRLIDSILLLFRANQWVAKLNEVSKQTFDTVNKTVK